MPSLHHRIAHSQNFLRSPRLVDRLLDHSGIGSDDLVIEIGPVMASSPSGWPRVAGRCWRLSRTRSWWRSCGASLRIPPTWPSSPATSWRWPGNGWRQSRGHENNSSGNSSSCRRCIVRGPRARPARPASHGRVSAEKEIDNRPSRVFSRAGVLRRRVPTIGTARPSLSAFRRQPRASFAMSHRPHRARANPRSPPRRGTLLCRPR